MSIRQQAFSGVRWTTLSSVGRILLQLLQVAILARILSPADFGLVAVVMAVLAVVQIVSDAGVSNAILHYRDVTAHELASLYWLNVAIGGLLAAAIAVAGHWVAVIYSEPQLQSLLTIAAGTLFAATMGQQLRVVAQKQLRFAELARVDLGGSLAGCAVAITAALAGGRAYSLVLGSLAAAAATTGLAWWLLSDGWRPRLRIDRRETRRFVRFGAFMVGGNLANTLNSQVDVLLGAQLLGAPSMGLYSVPKDLSLRLASVINPIVTDVSSPVMAGAQTDEGLLRRLYLQMMRMIASVSFPAYLALAVFAPEIVRLALGAAWESAAPLLRILSCWALVRSTGNPVGTLVMARGRPELSFLWNLVLLVSIPPAVWIGSRYGISGMAVAMLMVALLLYLPNWYFIVRPLCGAQLGEYSRQLVVPLGLSLVAAAAGYVGTRAVDGDLVRLLLGGALGGSVYLAASWYFNRAWLRAMLELLGVTRWRCAPRLEGAGPKSIRVARTGASPHRAPNVTSPEPTATLPQHADRGRGVQ